MTLPQAIELFRQGVAAPMGWDQREYATNSCGAASWAFEKLLASCDIPFEPYAVAVEHGPGTLYHVITQVGDIYVDWTARQLLPNADFPQIYTRVLLDELEWRDLDPQEAAEVALVKQAQMEETPEATIGACRFALKASRVSPYFVREEA